MSSTRKTKLRDMEAAALSTATGTLFGSGSDAAAGGPASSSSASAARSGLYEMEREVAASASAGNASAAPSVGGDAKAGFAGECNASIGALNATDLNTMHVSFGNDEGLFGSAHVARDGLGGSSHGSVGAGSDAPSEDDDRVRRGDGPGFDDVSFDKAVDDFADRAYGFSSDAWRKQRRFMRLVVVFTLFGAALVTTAVILLRGFRGRASHTSPADLTGEELVRYDAVHFRLVHDGITEALYLEPSVPATPQHAALRWLAVEDGARLEAEDEFLPQRYALAVFWYATHGHIHSSPTNGGEEEEATRRKKRRRAQTKSTLKHGAAGKDWTDRTNWMTEAGICAWAGVHCDDADHYVTRLELPSNNIRGIIPPELFYILRELVAVDLSDNDLDGPLPIEMGNLKKVEIVRLASNDLMGPIPPTFGELVEAKKVDLGDNLLEGPLPVEIGAMAGLVELILFDNVLSGQIPDEIGGLAKLEALRLDSNEFTGTVPERLFDLTKLYDLRLSENHLTGTLSSRIGDLSVLETLRLDKNELTGSVTPDLSRCGHLTEANFESNALTGTLPSELGSLTNLAVFRAEGNGLTGPIPPEWGTGLRHLKELRLSDNLLDGPIPESVGELKDLAVLRASGNRIEGTIPPQIGDCYELRLLSLEDNELGGTVPEEMGHLLNLAELRIHGNSITGTVPAKVCDLRREVLMEFASDCGGKRPEVECSCCTECMG